MEEKELLFQNIESKNFFRTFSNATYLSQSSTGDLCIDFYEEYVDSVKMLDKGEPDASIYINREKRVTVTMSESEAVFLAQRILEQYEDSESLEDGEDD